MPRQSKFTIKDKELADALEISVEALYEVIAVFDSDPDDEWELKEKEHFLIDNQKWGNRIFSPQGAFAIAKYLDTHGKKSIWDRIREFVTHHRQKIRNAFVQKTVHENSSSLVARNNRHFLSKADTVAILGTSYCRLNTAFKELLQSDSPLEPGADYDDIDGVRYYSLSGLYRLSQNLSQMLKSKDRREWCKAVDVAGKATFQAIIDAETKRNQRIKKAKDAAKRRDKQTCQITLVKRTMHNHDFDLAGHHIFSSHHYPHLSAVEDNIITIESTVHSEFHQWNGGNSNACTANDLLQFICERYPASTKAIARIAEVDRIFGYTQSPLDRAQVNNQRISPKKAA